MPFAFVLICNYFSFGLTTLAWKSLSTSQSIIIAVGVLWSHLTTAQTSCPRKVEVRCKMKSYARSHRPQAGNKDLLKVQVGPGNQTNIAFVGSQNDSNDHTGKEEAMFLKSLYPCRYPYKSRFYIGRKDRLEEMRKIKWMPCQTTWGSLPFCMHLKIFQASVNC